jgi:hypothetical protein
MGFSLVCESSSTHGKHVVEIVSLRLATHQMVSSNAQVGAQHHLLDKREVRLGPEGALADRIAKAITALVLDPASSWPTPNTNYRLR